MYICSPTLSYKKQNNNVNKCKILPDELGKNSLSKEHESYHSTLVVEGDDREIIKKSLHYNNDKEIYLLEKKLRIFSIDILSFTKEEGSTYWACREIKMCTKRNYNRGRYSSE